MRKKKINKISVFLMVVLSIGYLSISAEENSSLVSNTNKENKIQSSSLIDNENNKTDYVNPSENNEEESIDNQVSLEDNPSEMVVEVENEDEYTIEISDDSDTEEDSKSEVLNEEQNKEDLIVKSNTESVTTEDTFQEVQSKKESSITPFAFMDTVSTPAELVESITSAAEGDVITLGPLFNINADLTIPTPSVSVTINGNGFDFGSYKLNINNGIGTLNINNLFFGTASKSAIDVYSAGTISLDNITIKNRTAGNGAAIFIGGYGYSGNISITNSTIEDNRSNMSGYTGAGIFTDSHTGSITISNTKFISNKNLVTGSVFGGEGGAIMIRRSMGIVRIIDSYFEGNEAVVDAAGGLIDLADGGAIAFFDIKTGSNILVEGNTFHRNLAGADGGAMLLQFEDAIGNGLVNIVNNTFYENESYSKGTGTNPPNTSSANSGGAIQLYQKGNLKTSYITFTSNTFVNNTTGTAGGAISGSAGGFLSYVRTNLINNIFVGNIGSTSPYNNVAVSLGTNQGNIGVDNGTTNTVDVSNVYGDYGISLFANYNTITAGTSIDSIIIPTLPIMPKGNADSMGVNNPNPIDQRGFGRNISTPDVGSVEIVYLEINANTGTWDDFNQTEFDGTYYYNENTQMYYKVGYPNQSLTITKPSELTKSGYTFVGFNSQPDGLGDTYEIGDSITIDGKTTIYAIWEEDVVPNTYTVTYYGNGNTGGVVPIDANSPYLEDSLVTVLAQDNLVKAGYTFVGWNTQANGLGTMYQPSAEITITENITLYAIWEEDVVPNTYTVTYHGNGNTEGVVPIDANSPYLEDSLVTVLAQGNLVKTGYTFVGWNTQANGLGTMYQPSAEITITENITLYAIWEEDVVPNTYTVTYHGNGNTGGVVPIDANSPYLEDSLVTVLAPGNLVKTGYTFVGWNTQADGRGVMYQSFDTLNIHNNIILFATWEKDSNTVDKPTTPSLPNTGKIDPINNSIILISLGALLLVVKELRKNK